MPGVVLDVPVDPDRETARRWLQEELSRPEYSTEPSLLERLVAWLTSLFEDVRVPDVPGWQLALVTVLVVAAVVLVGWWVAGPVRLARRGARESAVVLEDDTRTAAELRAAADAAAARGDWSTAVLERFRAVVRALEERVVLTEQPGRTAREAADAAAARLPGVAADLHRAAALFDDVRYGELPARAQDDAFLRTLDARAAAERPAGTAVDGDAPAHHLAGAP
ncbi:DUF4129 domain-containing protein [Isoptericola variabilis]|uniref:Protein-glutamine gamma-glutamyltransferase-like C-terminal domain-containing protein n=1 Tax=Isoptericola variabilis (strain 225) TaxID=743718 RepID=F6FRL9_ISOV2|nr:DUF4129 domain-containing protein [Isoptericola variabilis]AEG45077.1 hypothetical protein Isova_2360 [Isoptericola variabilis 225]TWH26204.1 uncharacterized protein DUF4129 [Isoptericola variabilis J7]